MEAALNRLEREPSATQARMRWLNLIAESRPEDLSLLLERLPEDMPSLMPMLIDQWLERDPEGFAQALDRVSPSPKWPAMWSRPFFQKWAEKDPEAAFAGAERMDGLQSPFASGSVIAAILEQDAFQAIRLGTQSEAPFLGVIPAYLTKQGAALLENLDALQRLPPSPLRDRGIAAAAGELAKTDLQSALALADSLDGLGHAGARDQVALAWVKAAPEDARRFIDAAPPGAFPMQVAGNYCREWAGSRPAEVIPLALRWMKGGPRQFVLQQAFAALEKSDPAQAAALRETLPRPVPPREY